MRHRVPGPSFAVRAGLSAVLLLGLHACTGSPRATQQGAQLRSQIATLRSRGEYDAAARLADSALAARRHDAGAKPVEVADLARLSSTLRYPAGLEDPTRARRAPGAAAARRHDGGAKPVEVADLARLSSTLRYAAGLDDTTRERLAEADGLTSQIDSLSLQGDFATAFKDARQQLSTREAILGSSHLEVAESMLRLGELATARGQIPENTGGCERALAIRRRGLGPDPPDVIRAEITLLNARRKVAGGYAVREPLRRVVERARVILGPDAPDRK